MNNDPNQNNLKSQPEDGSSEDLNLTNSDASLKSRTPTQADAPTMSDNATSAANENLTQSAMKDGEVNPEFGDSADPTFEML